MAYFTNDMENIRLCVLYMLKVLNAKVTDTQLITAVTEATQMGYFDAQLAIAELEDKGFIASAPGVRGMIYAVTPAGDETLELMSKKMPRSLRKACEDYADKYRDKIMNLGYFSAHKNKNPAGGYDVFLTSMDNERIVLSIALNVADSEICEKMCDAWESRSGEIYDAIYGILLKD